ncbi:phosphatidylglycerol lysyltransferase domain-containing protein [Vannielia litorea]|uniref:Phosphatidylglycerol lysyltransferase n=1 Tax=Vannielia litorea TaxID=1217970 RepID=A0A1N6FDN5_9RHOB|nr:phosphatidylglycerol lysyltransferase domain-containing protein [Vannielia litorea]SIN93367.1 phosphatidylglycerol lysyltransferase [Vannielia litorea]
MGEVSHRLHRAAGTLKRAGLGRLVLRQGLPILAVLALLPVLAGWLQGLDLAAGWALLAGLPGHRWVGALCMTAVSFWALGRYDLAIHRWLSTGQNEDAAQGAGVTAIAVGQSTGFGLVIGALVRWRMLPGLGLARALGVTAAVALSFLAGWALFTSLCLLALPSAFPHAAPVGALGVLAGGFIVALCLWPPGWGGLARLPRLPSIWLASRIATFATLDCTAAALAFWLLLPPGTELAFGALLPAFLVALGAGIIGGTPGGAGPFEATLAVMLAQVDGAALACAILGFRLVYYALPAGLGLLAAAAGPMRSLATLRIEREALSRQRPVFRRAGRPPSPDLGWHLATADRAEAGLLRQGELGWLEAPGSGGGWAAAPTGSALVAIGAPFGPWGAARHWIAALRAEARSRGLAPVIYKAGARMAASAREAGFCVVPVAEEAVLDPTGFCLDSPEHRQLRRKLRRAEKAGLVITREMGPPDPATSAEMAAVSAAWEAGRGGARGFSMGRFCPVYIGHQHRYVARSRGRILGFASFHVSTREWVLDLMRTLPDSPEGGTAAPDGTMHALVLRAIEEAAARGCPRLSLAAVPLRGTPAEDSGTPPLFAALRARLDEATGGAGLRQFKACFAPRWEPLYMAAPNRLALALAAVDIARRVARPRALPRLGPEFAAPGGLAPPRTADRAAREQAPPLRRAS